jgi:hypothetical protein
MDHHLAYAPEIAPVMLRRQQASAVIAARKLVVAGRSTSSRKPSKSSGGNRHRSRPRTQGGHGVEPAGVLVSDKDATPVVNTGTLYA